ncbi:DUF2690 domain-containing protein [Actinosynnema pretiosum subsp. pretiosum]|uniref:DUF2690 domain-containing protein n=1 Tax=Actinosynnema pretiosum subsp. pretiosum TaxID=103721 RepID=A0AA45L9A5_9PSEU|nr:hypothetical protein APASM_3377 [Actinosynnema pretiosum subsp. pretiosum]QUF05140.1 DUF2690 domain-containing protein [Actinosynnema pretiosum subsp. pretiosum]
MTVVVLLALTVMNPAAVAQERTPASAAAWACGAICNWEDPQTFQVSSPYGLIRCGDDAITAKQAGVQYGITLQLRYSPRCRTVWPRAFGGSAKHNSYVLFLRDNYGSHSPMLEYFWKTGGRNWGNMLNDADLCTSARVGHDWGSSSIFGWTDCY